MVALGRAAAKCEAIPSELASAGKIAAQLADPVRYSSVQGLCVGLRCLGFVLMYRHSLSAATAVAAATVRSGKALTTPTALKVGSGDDFGILPGAGQLCVTLRADSDRWGAVLESALLEYLVCDVNVLWLATVKQLLTYTDGLCVVISDINTLKETILATVLAELEVDAVLAPFKTSVRHGNFRLFVL